MTALTQPLTTLSDSSALKRVISDYIFNIDPMDTPVVARLGLDSANTKFKISMDAKSYKVELLEDTYQPLTTTMNNTTTLTTATLSFTVTDGGIFQSGFEILVDSEYMVVASVSANVVTVDSRAYGGTNATHTATVAISIVGMARTEGRDADYVGLTALSNPYNYTSIFQKGVKVTGSQDVESQYGKPAGELQYQENKVVPELSRWIERMFFHGKRRIHTSSVARSFGNADTYMTTTTSITTTITKAAVDAAAKTIYDAGGNPDILILPTAAAQTLHGLLDNSSFLRVMQENTRFGMAPVTRISTQFFDNIEVLVSRHCPVTKAYMVDSRKVGFYTYRPFFSHPLAITGDSTPREVVGEFSLLVANGAKGHNVIVTSNSTL